MEDIEFIHSIAIYWYNNNIFNNKIDIMRNIKVTLSFQISDEDFNSEEFQEGIQEIIEGDEESMVDSYPSLVNYEQTIEVD